MICPRCKTELPEDSKYCLSCGRKLIKEQTHRKRANGEGTIYTLPNGVIRAVKTFGYEVYQDGEKTKKRPVAKSKQGFATKREAQAWLSSGVNKHEKNIKFKKLYDLWIPTHSTSKSTIYCYNAAMKYFKPLWFANTQDIDVDDLQECIDDCEKGIQTRRNMRTVIGLIYKYGIPRGYFPMQINLAQHLTVGNSDQRSKSGFTDAELEKIRKGIDKVEYADMIYALCYLGFRLSEFLELDARNYNRAENAFVGGKKTEAGTDRTVTVSPKIQNIIDKYTKDKISGPVFSKDGKQIYIAEFREYFYAALSSLGIDNPITKVRGQEMHRLTPHSCRHTFATLMKRVEGADKDKLELIGHTSMEMLQYYQDVEFSDLRKITNAL